MKLLYGVTVAMVTPIGRDNKIIAKSVKEITNFLIDKGVNCLYPLGTTGEMYHLDLQERKEVAEIVVEHANRRVPVFIHVGAMRSDETIQLAQHAYEIGADGIGAVTPSYFSVNDKEMEEYYLSISRNIPEDFPLYLYNIPQCSGNDLTSEVAEKIAGKCANIVGIKYSYPDFIRTNEYLRINNGKFSVLHGTDRLFYTILTMGCSGIVSGTACVFPEVFTNIYNAYKKGDIKEAFRLQKIAFKLGEILKNGRNMSYFKEALKLRGLNAGVMRRPQLDIDKKEIKVLKENIDSLGIIL
jgi:dihydrodipicolinate synthase/N-acetylneuraminate lyase